MLSIDVPFAGPHVEAMSTVELLANLEASREGADVVLPSLRLLARMEAEWLERPLQDRIAAEKTLQFP